MNPLYILYTCDQFWPSQWLIVYGRWICGFYPFLDSRKNTIIGTWGFYGISISTNIDPQNGMFGGWKAVFQLPQLASSQNLRSRGSIDIWMTQSNRNHVGSESAKQILESDLGITNPYFSNTHTRIYIYIIINLK